MRSAPSRAGNQGGRARRGGGGGAPRRAEGRGRAGGGRERGLGCRSGRERSLYLHQDGRVVKALDLRSNGRMSAWVRTPLLVVTFFLRSPVTWPARARCPDRGAAAGSREPPGRGEGRGAALERPAAGSRLRGSGAALPALGGGSALGGSGCSGPGRVGPPGAASGAVTLC